MEAWPNHLRRLARQRDKGVCRLCGLDTYRWEREIESRFRGVSADLARLRPVAYVSSARVRYYRLVYPDVKLRKFYLDEADRLPHIWSAAYLVERDFLIWLAQQPEGMVRHWAIDTTKSYWEADHIVPLAEGGENKLENVQTLCAACHRAETAKLRRRLADRNRPVEFRQVSLFDLSDPSDNVELEKRGGEDDAT